ncbi:MAG TPA: hypothetical protein VFU22_10115 [Roseiflexaceae bacterium]|nr:hypothetical protein [Roseiflexaceae bacterium]
MSTYWPIGFVRSADLWVECVSGMAGSRPLLSCDEPFLASKRILRQPERSPSEVSPVLTIEQRLKLDMFLAPLQIWTVAAVAADEPWRVTSCFAPRLHRTGELDFVAAYPAGSQALALISTSAEVAFWVSDAQAGCYLEGRAHATIVRWAWEQAELQAYLRWRMPNQMSELSGPIEAVVFRPISLLYRDPAPAACFEVKW